MKQLVFENYIVIIKVFFLIASINFISWLIAKWECEKSVINWDYFVGSTLSGIIFLLSRWILIAMTLIVLIGLFIEWYF